MKAFRVPLVRGISMQEFRGLDGIIIRRNYIDLRRLFVIVRAANEVEYFTIG